MENIGQDIETLIDAFVKGTITEEEFSQLETWAHECESNREYVRDLREMIFSQDVLNDPTHYDVETAIKRFHCYVSKSQSDRVPQSVVSIPVVSFWKQVIRIAAILLLLILPVFTYYAGHHKVERQFAEVIMEAPDGSQLNLTLPDGTKVRLNSGSRLSYSQGYGIVDRKLTLSGEGYFKVHHSNKLPFTIKTRGLVIQDLGTEFNVRDYSDDEQASVDLFHGSVEVHNEVLPSKPIFLTPGESLTLNKRTGKILQTKNDGDMSSAQMMNDLNFINMRIDDIAKQLSRAYGIDIEVVDSVRNRRFYGFFNRKEDTLNRILKVMSDTNLIKYKRIRDKYVIF
ncbi:MAG: FecR family protein [Prevotella sp.]|jgi:ferric-dicitrate binding protein FerR (iron transport regulator)|nr:FecR family protein [Prevotella sp.]MCH4242147.1 FecR family protein [Prevotella sp.]MCI1686125.1 FecR family protein [Prevotella sp.]MCI1781582.1 FecR family protein [Prevotella sp.]MCI1802144.1 FecR family protein [Prevotella sp.]MCI1816837.1 FecR family protein [Prevotella sp.]